MEKPTAVIYDVDGTMANVSGIRHYVRGPVKDFEKFHAESINCPTNPEVVAHMEESRAAGHAIIVVTARRQRWFYHTIIWMNENGIEWDEIFMRGDKDMRPDYEVKSDIIRVIKQKWNPVHAVDDNPSVIQVWKENGIETTIVKGWEE